MRPGHVVEAGNPLELDAGTWHALPGLKEFSRLVEKSRKVLFHSEVGLEDRGRTGRARVDRQPGGEKPRRPLLVTCFLELPGMRKERFARGVENEDEE